MKVRIAVALVLVAAMLAAVALSWYVVSLVLAVAAVGWWTSMAARGRVGAPIVDQSHSDGPAAAVDSARLRGTGLL